MEDNRIPWPLWPGNVDASASSRPTIHLPPLPHGGPPLSNPQSLVMGQRPTTSGHGLAAMQFQAHPVSTMLQSSHFLPGVRPCGPTAARTGYSSLPSLMPQPRGYEQRSYNGRPTFFQQTPQFQHWVQPLNVARSDSSLNAPGKLPSGNYYLQAVLQRIEEKRFMKGWDNLCSFKIKDQIRLVLEKLEQLKEL